jgi:hypothetical protein
MPASVYAPALRETQPAFATPLSAAAIADSFSHDDAMPLLMPLI